MFCLFGEFLADNLFHTPLGAQAADWGCWLGFAPLILLVGGLGAVLWYRTVGFRAVKVDRPDAVSAIRKPWYKGMLVAGLISVLLGLASLSMEHLLSDTRVIFAGLSVMVVTALFSMLVYWIVCASARWVLPARSRYVAGPLPRR